MTPKIAIASLALVALCHHAAADKFYVGTEADSKKTVGNAAPSDFIEGVLLKQDQDTYTIRVLGGELTLAKASVRKHERDGLTVAQLETQEAARAAQLTQSSTNRRQVQAAEASARRDARATEAAARPERPRRLEINVDFQGILGHFRSGGRAIKPFDPVINRANLSGLAAIVDGYIKGRLVADRGRYTRATRSLPVTIDLGAGLTPQTFRTFDVDLTQEELDSLSDKIHAHVKREVLLAAHRNPDAENMNLPYRRRY